MIFVFLNPPPPARSAWFFRLFFMLALGLAGMSAWADPPNRVARLNHIEGAVVSSTSGDSEWTNVVLNRPLTRGDRLWVDQTSRGEFHVGSSALRMDGQTQVGFTVLDDLAAQLILTRGSLWVTVRNLGEGESLELGTPNLAFRPAQPGSYRIDVDPARGTTRVTVLAGSGMAYGQGGQSLTLRRGQQTVFTGRALTPLATQVAAAPDAFDRWTDERNLLEEQSISARYLPREVTGYLQLDGHGEWSQDTVHGPVWHPRVAANWTPYRHGRWDWISPWGWTWIDDAPWAFATSHFGRWTQINARWAWVPGALPARPVYAPALVAFVGGNGGVDWSVQAASGRPEAAWFPLAPGEAWRPGFKASISYVNNVNFDIAIADPPGGIYAHQRGGDAVTATAGQTRRPVQRSKPARPVSPVPGAAPIEQRAAIAAQMPTRPAEEQLARIEQSREEQSSRERHAQLARREESDRARRQAVHQAQARRAAWQRQQQALSEQWKAEHAATQKRLQQQVASQGEVYAQQQQGVMMRPQGVPILRQR